MRAALPLYEKSHSWGEFVFDWAWAHAYEQAGLAYYPKLVSAVPFTPAPSTRILLADTNDTEAAQALIAAATQLAVETECSSVHFLFPTPNGKFALFEEQDLLSARTASFTGITAATAASMISWRRLHRQNARKPARDRRRVA